MTENLLTSKDNLSPSKQMLLALKKAQWQLKELESLKNEPIAIIGMGCRFPGNADSPDKFWQLLHNGVDAITEVPSLRWNLDSYYDSNPEAPGKLYNRYGGFLQEDIQQFDPQFFGISPREAMTLDPQQRLLLEVSWEALENAGQNPYELTGSLTGVFIGTTQNDYGMKVVKQFRPEQYDLYTLTGTLLANVAGRLSFTLGIQGPCLITDTACSSSLVAVHLACQSLRAKECHLALTGGVHINLLPEFSISLSKAKALAPDGRCKTFDAKADGFSRGEGCGMIVLKRLSDAVAQGDRIMAVIRGSATIHDGPGGLTVPNPVAQVKVIRQALKNAKVEPLQVSYLEAHGTGTHLGDPTEMQAIASVLCQNRSRNQPLIVGAVKTNIGHLEPAAGIAGLMKIVLLLQHEQICPNLHFSQPNPEIPWDDLPVVVPTSSRPWNRQKQPRIAGVSAFGLSGTNAHVILEEAPIQVRQPTLPERPLHQLTLSAKTEGALEQLISSYQNHLQTHPELDIADICFTANTGRAHFQYRLAANATNREQLVEKLSCLTAGEEVAGVFRGQFSSQKGTPKIVFLFTGQGSAYVNMGRQLYEQAPVFREAVDTCDEILRSQLDKPLKEILYPEHTEAELSSTLINQTVYTQPAIFTIEYALAKLWLSWGIQPEVMMGHSLGEYAPACIAGIFSLEEGLKLIAHRGRLMQQSPRGEMVTVIASAAQVKPLIAPYAEVVSLAAINGPQSVVISGASEAIRAICRQLDSQGIKHKPIQAFHAFHSPLMEPILAEFAVIANQITYNSPQIKMISTLTGKLTDESIKTAQYWVEHARQPVQFLKGMETLRQQGYEIFLETGPKPISLGMGRQCLPADQGVWLPSLYPPHQEWPQMLQSLGQLYVQGIKVDWAQFDRDYIRSKVVLPTYPFQRQRYWLETNQNIQKKQRFSGGDRLHPLLGQKFNSAAQPQLIQFESQIAAFEPAYLSHHRVFDKTLLPATAYLEIALAAGAKLLKTLHLVVADMEIERGLILPEEDLKTVQTILTPLENGAYQFQIFSESSKGDTEPLGWTLHAEGNIQRLTVALAPLAIDLEKCKAEFTQPIEVQECYQQFKQLGINYGTSFQGIQQLWRNSHQSLGKIQLPQELIGELTDYQLHPALLDACLQVMVMALFRKANSQTTYLPVEINSLRVYQRPSQTLWAMGSIEARSKAKEQTLTGEVQLVDEQGTVVAQIEGVTLLATTSQALLRTLDPDMSHWFYEIAWRPQPLEINYQAIAPTKVGRWLLFAPSTEIGDLMAETWQQQGRECIVVSPGRDYQQFDSQHYQVNPLQPQEFEKLLQESRRQIPSFDGIVHLWGVQPKNESLSVEKLQTAQELGCASVLHLLQALIKTQPSNIPQLWLVTQGTQNVLSATEVVQPEQASLWGLGRVIALEHPEFQCQRVDLDPTLNFQPIAQTLVREILSNHSEDQIAYRQEQRYVARLVRHQKQSAKVLAKRTIPENQPVQLKLSEYGLLDNLSLQSMQRRRPSAKKVEIQVKAVGLNFRDVLNALGMLKDYYAENLGITCAEQLTFGFECSGIIVAVGEEVSQWQLGDEVMATMLYNGFSSFITTAADLVLAKPPNWSFEEAATLPIAFLTAYYGLHQLAHLQPGDRVLIHAAAGGVGQAAVQIAQAIGAEIFATASPAKWEFLKSMGVSNVMNSRTTKFADDIMILTGGEGVEVILNSLNGEFIDKSFQVLAKGGRFVEIGKIGIWTPQKAIAKRPDAQYFPYDLGEVAQQQPGLIVQLLQKLQTEFHQGTFKPLPHRIFPIAEVIEAFRYVQQAKQIGKVVISMTLPESKIRQPVSILAEGSYLITGGLGALGLEVAQWLAAQGARHLVLTGRQKPSATALPTIEKLEQAGTQVSVLLGDISCEPEVATLLKTIGSSLPPLRGIIHAAGILDDGILQSLSWERFTKVLSPKVAGLLHLHRMTQHLPLDFLVCFSSVAALLGSSGQGNYAAANAFMDAFAHYRRGLGLPGLSINWGPWQAGGMAARLSSQHQSRLEATGYSTIATSQGMQALAELLSQPTIQVGVFPINWQQFLQQLPGGNKMPFLEAFTSVESVKTPQSAQQVELLEQLQKASGEDCQTILVTYLQQQVAKVLQFEGTANLNPHHALNELGLDSLTGVELRNQVKRQLGLTLSAKTILQGPSIMELAAELAQQLTKGGSVSDTESHGEIKELAETTTSWFAYHKAKPKARLNLFCFHPIGGNASLYREWSEGLPSDIVVLPVQFPGREARFKEPPLTQFNPLIETLAEVLLHKLDKPFAFYGHSFGVLISFELAHFLHYKYALSPQHLFLGGLYPPEIFVSQQIWSAPPEQILNYYLSEISEIPQSVREDETMFEELVRTFKADIQLALDYHYSPKEKLSCPISVFGGINDPIASEQELLQWRNYTGNAFKLHRFPGKHLFLRDSQKLLLDAIAQELRIDSIGHF